MRKWLNSSFRRKLMAAFLAVGVIPLLTCTVLMLNVFRISLAQEAEETAVSQPGSYTHLRAHQSP